MTKWVTKKLGEIVIPTKGRLTEQSSSYLVGWQPLINTSAIEGEAKDWANPNQGILCEPNDVLMLWDGERSGLVINGKTGVVGSTFARLRPNNEILGKLLYYILDFNFEWIQNRRTGTGVPHAPKDLMRILEISFPESLAEQRRIAAILSSADKVIATSEALIEKYKHIKQGMLTDLLQPKEGWKKVKLGECLNRLCNGLTYDVEEKNGYMVTRIETISNDNIDYNKVGHISKLPKQEYKIQKGDILFSHINSVKHIGKVAYFDDEQELYHGMNLLLMRFKESCDSKYFFYMLTSEEVRKRMRSLAKSAVNQASINTTELHSFPITYPSDLTEQRRIASILSSIDAKILAEAKVVEKYKGVKKGLMNEQFTMNNLQ